MLSTQNIEGVKVEAYLMREIESSESLGWERATKVAIWHVGRPVGGRG